MVTLGKVTAKCHAGGGMVAEDQGAGGDFAAEGFLGGEIDAWMTGYLAQHQTFYELLGDMNRFANGLKARMAAKPDDSRSSLAASLFIKASNCFQAIVLLSRKGLGIECAMLTRSLLEVVFPLRLIATDDKFVGEYVLSDKAKQLSLLNEIFEDKDSNLMFRSMISEMTTEQRERLKREVHAMHIKPIKVKDLARRADMFPFYQLAYRYLSEDVHTTVRSLESYFLPDGEGNITRFENGPIPFSTIHFRTAAYCLLVALESANTVFGLSAHRKIQAFQKQINGLTPGRPLDSNPPAVRTAEIRQAKEKKASARKPASTRKPTHDCPQALQQDESGSGFFTGAEISPEPV